MKSNSKMKAKNIKISLDFIEEYLDKIKEILGKQLGIDPDRISYYTASLHLKKRLDQKGGLVEK